MRPKSTNYNAALYMRLSKDDDGSTESASISTQRKMLLSYAKENGFHVYDEYVDDGFSGTNFERPAFKRMIQDIENKKVNLVITKDLSRLGRDYITAGQYTEIFFPSKCVRYIAINDGYDSDSPYTDIAPFKNVINEMYARDTSKKIRSAFVTRMQEGSYIGNFAPFGYRKDPNDKHHLIVDETAAPIVRRIFEMAANGSTPIEIARYLNSNGVPSPAVYRCSNYTHLDVDHYSKRRAWTSSTITKIFRNIVYLGHMAQAKTTKVSFKSHVTIYNPEDSWIVVENTHEPIVNEEIFDLVRRRSLSRTCAKSGSFFNIFSGIAKCADCGRNMSTVGNRKKGSPADLACGGYKLYGSGECSNHFIDYNVLYDIVLNAIREQIRLTSDEKSALISELQINVKDKTEGTFKKRELNALKKRSRELDGIIEKLYEDNVQGVLSDVRFRKLLDKYESEAQEIADRIEVLDKPSAEMSEQLSAKESYAKFAKLIREYTDIEALTPDLLFKLIDHINVGQGYYEKTEDGRVKHQKVKIYFRFLGKATVKQYKI